MRSIVLGLMLAGCAHRTQADVDAEVARYVPRPVAAPRAQPERENPPAPAPTPEPVAAQPSASTEACAANRRDREIRARREIVAMVKGVEFYRAHTKWAGEHCTITADGQDLVCNAPKPAGFPTLQEMRDARAELSAYFGVDECSVEDRAAGRVPLFVSASDAEGIGQILSLPH